MLMTVSITPILKIEKRKSRNDTQESFKLQWGGRFTREIYTTVVCEIDSQFEVESSLADVVMDRDLCLVRLFPPNY